MDIGIQQATGRSISTPLPLSWLGRPDAPMTPIITDIPQFTVANIKNLQAQIGYDLSQWDYSKIGTDNALGRYQFSTTLLESYGLLAVGSNEHYSTDCVNYRTCWRAVVIRKNSNSYANYIYNVSSLTDFLSSTASQEHLAYQVILDTYIDLLTINAIQATDTADIIAGMIYVGWTLGVGIRPSAEHITGTGAYAWRYSGIGNGSNAFNSGRYAITILSQ